MAPLHAKRSLSLPEREENHFRSHFVEMMLTCERHFVKGDSALVKAIKGTVAKDKVLLRARTLHALKERVAKLVIS